MGDTQSNSKIRIRIYVGISVALMALSCLLTYLVYLPAFNKLIESCKDFGLSMANYAVFSLKRVLSSVPDIPVSVASPPSFSAYTDYIGVDLDTIFESISDFVSAALSIPNLMAFNKYLLRRLVKALLYISMFLPLIYMGISSIGDYYFTEKDDLLGTRTKPYRIFIFVLLKIRVVIDAVVGYFTYFFSKWYFKIPFVIVWFVNFGLWCFVLDFFAFYFYFFISLDYVALIYVLERLMLDLLIAVKGVPLWLALTVVIILRHRHYKNIALDTLRHNEAKNCGLLNELELVVLIVGEPGKGKTTLLTDMVLSFVNIYKTNSLATLYKIEMYFPGVDFSCYRALLVQKVASHDIFCLPNVDGIAAAFYDDYMNNLSSTEKEFFSDSVDLGNRKLELLDALVIYGRAFVIYQNNNSTVSNFSIRFDGTFDESSLLQLWDGDFFEVSGESYYAHVLDSDIMRFGKKVDPKGKFNGSFGPGVWVRTEAAKSYGNQVSNAGYDRQSDEANPLNDLVEYSLMMGRHPNATVDNKVYFRMLMDEQRASDLTARIRELCSIISIKEKGELKLAIGGYDWLFKLRDKLSRFEGFYLKYQNVRSDISLSLAIPKFFVSFVKLCCERLENIYGYREITLVKECGNAYSTGGVVADPKELIWYQANMKVYSGRFATDCYASFFTELQLKCGYGIMDIPEYKSLYPTNEEYELQKDFFLMKMIGNVYGEDEELKEVRTRHRRAAKDVFADLVCDD